MTNNILFNNNWSFSKASLGITVEEAQKLEYINVEIPHDWLIYQTKDLYETGEGWYKKIFILSEEDMNKDISLYFEGVYMDSTYFLNGKEVGEWKYGYSTFSIDLNAAMQVGENEILVRCVFQCPNSRWYSGAGIYRNVRLLTKEKTHILTNGIYVSTEKCDDSDYNMRIETELVSDESCDVVVIHSLSDQNGNTKVEKERTVHLTNGQAKHKTKIRNFSAHEWDVDRPYLYTLKTQLFKDNCLIEEVTQKVGFRTISYDCNEGFFLNGRHLKLNGSCEHHDLGCLGAAMNRVEIGRAHV